MYLEDKHVEEVCGEVVVEVECGWLEIEKGKGGGGQDEEIWRGRKEAGFGQRGIKRSHSVGLRHVKGKF